MRLSNICVVEHSNTEKDKSDPPFSGLYIEITY